MKLLLLVCGKAEKIFTANQLNPKEFDVVKIDDKKLAKPGFIINLIKKKKYEAVFFGTIELELQRFHTFMKGYIFLSNSRSGAIIDEDRNQNQYSTSRFIFIEIPHLALEAVLSFFVILYSYVKYPVMKWLLTRKK